MSRDKRPDKTPYPFYCPACGYIDRPDFDTLMPSMRLALLSEMETT